MAYEVLARKWRPQQLDDVVGQEHVTRTLKNAIRSNRVAHAYLFIGPRGIGKTSIARILAKALNCQEGPTDKPCDKCPACLEIMAGTRLDVQEIDGASNRGIEDVRNLRDTIQYMPTGRFKVIIIDEVHQVTSDAFNALLKTLEEPPAHVKFIFATTEPQKIPATILSRCQRFDLRRIPLQPLMERLRLIAQSEGVTLEEDALLAIARAAEGGLRDAQSALDQLIAFQGKNITESDVLSIFGLVSRQALEELMTALLQGDVGVLIRLVEEWDQQGKDLQRLLVELLSYCRNLLVCMQVGASVAELDLTPAQVEVLQAQAALVSTDRLLRITDILTEAWDRLRYTLSKKIFMETVLIRCARLATTVALDEILEQVRALQKALAVPAAGPAPTASARQPELAPPPASSPEPAPAAREDELTLLLKEWPALVERVGRAAPLAKNNLQDARPLAVTAERVQIGFDPEFAYRVEQAALPRNLTVLQKVLSERFRRPLIAEFKVMAPEATPAAAPPPAPPAAGEKPPPKTSLRGKHKWLAQEVVQQTMDMFNGNILDIKE